MASGVNPVIFIRQTVQSFPSYHLEMEQKKSLIFCSDEDIQIGFNRNKFLTKFDIFYQNILNDLPNLPEHDTMTLKTKLRYTCNK